MVLKETDYPENHINIPNQRLLMFTGIWPYEELSSRLLRVRCINLTLVLLILHELHILFTLDLTMDSFYGIMQIFLPSLTITIVYNNLHYHPMTVRFLMDALRYRWEKKMNDEELKSMQRYSEESKLYSSIITWSLYLYIVIIIFPSMLYISLHVIGVMNDTQISTPIPTGFDKNNKLSYISILLFQCILLAITVSVIVAYCSMHLSFVQHACALFDITMIKINEPFKKNPDELDWPIFGNNREQEYDWIITVVKYYSEAINVVNLIKKICEKTLEIEAILALFFVMLDIFYLLQLNDLTENMSEKLKNFIYIGTTLLVPYTYCYLGQKVIDHNEGVFMKCCHVPFYGLSLKTQKILLLLIIKTMRPCNISMTGTFVVSHEIFLDFIRISFSYAMVFHNIQ